MRISELLLISTINFNNSIDRKEVLFTTAGNILEENGIVTNGKKFAKDLFKREKQTSTGIEDGFGIPHAKSRHVTKPALAFIKSSEISDYEALDGSKVNNSFIIAVPKSGSDQHLEILSQLSRKLMNNDFREMIKNADTPEQILDAMKTL